MICEKCGKEHDGSFGSGRFCSRSCANSHKHSEVQKQKISNSLKETRFKKDIIKQFETREKADRFISNFLRHKYADDYKAFMKATKSIRPYVAKVYGW